MLTARLPPEKATKRPVLIWVHVMTSPWRGIRRDRHHSPIEDVKLFDVGDRAGWARLTRCAVVLGFVEDAEGDSSVDQFC